MQSLGLFARVMVLIVLSMVTACLFLQCLTGQVRLRGLLAEKPAGTMDSGRVQLLVGALGLAFALLGHLPEMKVTHHLTLSSNALLVVAGTSHALYLVRKYRQRKS